MQKNPMKALRLLFVICFISGGVLMAQADNRYLLEDSITVQFEAEDADGLSSVWEVNSGDGASGEYIVYAGEKDSMSSPPAQAISFQFEAPVDGLYRLKMKTLASSSSSDSFWVKIQDADLSRSENITRQDKWVKYADIVQSSSFIWNNVHNNDAGNALVKFYLNKGVHWLDVGHREPGTKLDKVEIRSEESDDTDPPIDPYEDLDPEKAPAENFDLWTWKLTLPVEDPEDEGDVLEIKEAELNGPPAYVHPDWFLTDPKTGAMLFRVPNHAATTANSSNARSELREMLRRGDTDIGTHDPANNWVLSTHPDAESYGGIGGSMSATIAVDWVSTSGDDSKFPAHSVVVGQIHGSGKMEPLKIFFRKMPSHRKASLFWNYEICPEDEDDRVDIPHNVWGDWTLTDEDPEPADGLELGEIFSYDVDVVGTVMTLTFEKSNGEQRVHVFDLDAGHPDYALDQGYGNDWMYFKAGAYNQCNMGTESETWGTGCANDGIDAGDYAQVRFFKFSASH